MEQLWFLGKTENVNQMYCTTHFGFIIPKRLCEEHYPQTILKGG